MTFCTLNNIDMRNSIMQLIKDVDISFINVVKTYKAMLSRQEDRNFHTDLDTYINHVSLVNYLLLNTFRKHKIYKHI